MQHFYQNLAGYFDFAELYRAQVERASDGAHFVEVGALFGCSSAFMAVEIVNSTKRIRFDVIDPWEKSSWNTRLPGGAAVGPEGAITHFMRAHLDGGTLNVIWPIRARSTVAARMYEPASLDFVFIDGDHSTSAVAADIRAWAPKLKPTGILAGHDIDWETVRAGVRAQLGDGWWQAGRSWVMKR